jgi:hypothetical protein
MFAMWQVVNLSESGLLINSVLIALDSYEHVDS